MKKKLLVLYERIVIFFEKIIRKLIYSNVKIDSKIIVFESEGDYCDNARALYEYIISNNNDKYNLIWIVNDVKKYSLLNNKIKNVCFISRNNKNILNLIKFYKLIGQAKFFFFTHPYWFDFKKDGQIIINLWHGTPLKSGGRDLSDIYDYAVIPSKNVVPWFEKFIGVKSNQIILNGSPRNDLLFENNKVLKKLINYRKSDKIILVMPTFRQSKNMNDGDIINPFVIQKIETEKELLELNEYLKNKKVKLIVKIHHLQITNFIKKTNLSNIIYILDDDLNRNNIQLYNLVGECDALLTDYSSIYFDYLLLNRPIGFMIADIDEYKRKRGFIVDNPELFMPGMKIKTLDELYLFLENFVNGKDKYKKEREKILNFTNEFKTNNNCKTLLEKVIKLEEEK